MIYDFCMLEKRQGSGPPRLEKSTEEPIEAFLGLPFLVHSKSSTSDKLSTFSSIDDEFRAFSRVLQIRFSSCRKLFKYRIFNLAVFFS